MNINPMLLTDCYKISHRIMCGEGIEHIYSTFTPRGSRIFGIKGVVVFGLQGETKEFLIDYWNRNFFNRKKEKVVKEYKRIILNTLGEKAADTTHIEKLHDLGYLPIEIKALPEGIVCPIKVPVFTITNTHKDFYWLTNFLETVISCDMWKQYTAATICKQYYDIGKKWYHKTCETEDMLPYTFHNFSFRGMSGRADAINTGAGALIYSTGTDTLPSIPYLEEYYGANCETENIAKSVFATEHMIQCQYADDYQYIKRMIEEVVPEGIASLVIDGYDYWNVIQNIIPSLKSSIMNRNGKLVLRGDSGNPVKIICGYDFTEVSDLDHYTLLDVETEVIKHNGSYFKLNSFDTGWSTEFEFDELSEVEVKGTVESLWDIFGGPTNSKGYKTLDSHIGHIYGDSITPETTNEIFAALERKGFASDTVLLGAGSFSLGYHTRDTFNFALKATHVVINGEEKNIYKDPKTDKEKMKKSQTGRVVVVKNEQGEIELIDGLTIEQEKSYDRVNLLQTVFKDGVLYNETTLAEIRERALAA